MTSCSVTGCVGRHLAKGYCSAHYQRWRSHGDPLHVPTDKLCRACGERKPLNQFYVVKSGKDAGRPRSQCKQCISEASRRLNAERSKVDPYWSTKKSSAWRAANKQKDRHQHVRRMYGLTGEDYEAMLERQGNNCAICGGPFVATPTVDHDHLTGAVRGLLHQKCNNICGLAGDDPAMLRAAADYLERYR